mgnify:FL=1
MQAIAAGWKNGRAGGRAQPDSIPLPQPPDQKVISPGPGRRQLAHRASPRASADACADNLGMFYCVSSYLPTSGVNRSDYGPASLFDGSDRTAWVEGRTARRDDGVGEWILLDWQRERRIRGFTLKNGYWKSKRLFAANGRVTQLRARFSSGRTVDFALRDNARQQSVALRKPERATWVQLEILKARRGTKYSDTAITELQPRFD